MRTKLVTLSLLAGSVLGMLSFVGCCCLEGRSRPEGGPAPLLPPEAGQGELVLHTRGRARFIGLPAGPQAARLFLSGSYEFKGPAGNIPKIVSIELYCAPGLFENGGDVVTTGTKVDTIDPETILPDHLHWIYPALNTFSWNANSQKEGTVLARTTYNIATSSGTFGPYTADWLGQMKGIVASPLIEMTAKSTVRDPPLGATESTNSQAVCHGTFSGAQMMASYDVVVDYQIKSVKRIEIYSAPSEVVTPTSPTITLPAYLIFSQRSGFASPPYQWVENDVPGPYNGTSNEYVMVVRVIFTDNSHEDTGGRYHNILGQQGTTIIMD